jgi:solute carrier family 35 protein C2
MSGSARMSAPKSSYVAVSAAILAWYVLGSLLMSSNKVLFDLLHLDIPLLATFIHFSITAFALVIIRARWSDLIPQASITRSEYMRWIVPVAITTALDVGLSNMAYSYLPISVMTVLKSSSVVCIYTTGVVWGVEQFRWTVGLVCAVIAASIAFATPGFAGDEGLTDSKFVSGVIIVCVAVISLSIRWVLVQSLTKRYSPLQLLYLIQPTSALILLPFAAVLEINSKLFDMLSSSSLWLPILLVLGSAILAMCLLMTEYRIVHMTSSLTLSIAGIGKEILTLSLSMLIFDESFSLRQVIAISISIIGIFVYAILRSREQKMEQKMQEFELADSTDRAIRGDSPMSE